MKCALVTGGSRGIGSAICIRLATMGYHVLINFKQNHNAADDTLQQITAQGATGELCRFDVANKEEITRVLGDWILANPTKYIEVLVNNAGIRQDSLLAWMTGEQWDNVINTNLDSFFYTTKMVINGMMERRFGRIINIVSLSGQKGMAGQTNYSAAKAGVIGATKALAQEVGRQGITVNAIAPGFIKTDMTEDLNEKDLKNLIPVRRFGTPEEVAAAAAFFASAEASYITGQVLSVNGGLYT
jgi:3-oxoacyl-[acyl-carrier protein] reductase